MSSEISGGAPSLVWFTNIPTPYRLPLWTRLGGQLHLRVVFMAASERNRTWNGDALASAAGGVVVGAPSLTLGAETSLHLPTPRLHKQIPAASVVLIDGWESPAYLYIAAVCRGRRVPLVYFYRSTSATQRNSAAITLLRNWLFSRAGAVLTGGPTSSAAVRAMGVDEGRIVEGVNTVDVDEFTSVPRGAESPGLHRFVYVGQLIPRKNVNSLIAAVGSTADSSLTVVGDGPDRAALENQVTALGLGARVRFVGQLDPASVARTLAECDTLVLPSLQEVYGLVVPEALSAGLHCVISTGTGVLESVKGMRGVYPAEPTPDALAAAMVRSAEEWRGPIANPEILSHTTIRMVDAVLEAVAIAKTRYTR